MEISVPNSPPKIVHANLLKPSWQNTDSRALHVILAVADACEAPPTDGYPSQSLSESQIHWLQDLHICFEPVLSDTPGRTHIVEHSIDTRDTKPFWLSQNRQPSFRIVLIKNKRKNHR